MTITAADAPSSTNDADILRETERARLRALVSADVVRARQLHAPDFQLITPIGAALSKDEYLGAIASGQIRYRTWEPAEIAVRLYDSGAVIRYRAQLEVIFSGHRVPLHDYWHTDIYERREGKWMVVWSQATSVT